MTALAFQRVDTGTATVSVDELLEEGYRAWRSGPLPQARVLRCDIMLEVRHTRSGTIDPAFKNGSIVAGFTRSVTLDYTPSQR